MAQIVETGTPVRYAELLVRLAAQRAQTYRAELQFTQPGSGAPTEPDVGQVTLDLEELGSLLNQPAEYQRVLSQALFADATIREALKTATKIADVREAALRFRLQIDSDAAELHALRWEVLCDPDGTPLATGERVLFSRYLRSPDWRRVALRPECELRALVVIASPDNLDSYHPEGSPLQPIDVAGELERTLRALGDIPVTALVSRPDVCLPLRAGVKLAAPGGATLENLVTQLRRGYDIVYVVCHGAFVREQPRLFVENEAGTVATIGGDELVQELAELRERQMPSLVVLASCQSAGSGSRGTLSALGPLLARAGVPAVLAMQERIEVETAQEFMEVFFTELRRDWQLDRAVAVARHKVRERADAWVPVLFTRLASGRIGSAQAPAPEDFAKWPSLKQQIEQARCTPILGPGLIEFLLGSPREIAQRWADTYRFPMSPHDRQDLPQVAQFLAVNQNPEFPAYELDKYLQKELLDRYGDQLPATLPGDSVDKLVSDVGRAHRREHPDDDAYGVLARLPFRIYITANPDNLLRDALRDAGKEPVVELCRWTEDVDWPEEPLQTRDPDYQPTVERPLVYHLFGQLGTPGSLVLTEDQYFEYLIGVTKDSVLIPTPVSRALSTNALLFLGFQMEDWNFRVVFRSVMGEQGSTLRKRSPHVAVQIDPEEGSSLDPRRAKQYLETYLGSDNISVYWGSTEQFVRELWRQTVQDGAAVASRPLVGMA